MHWSFAGFGWVRHLHSMDCGLGLWSKVLITQGCFSHCSAGLLCLSEHPTSERLGVHKHMGGDTAGTADPRDSPEHMVPCSAMKPSRKFGCVVISQELTRHRSAGVAFYQLGFLFLSLIFFVCFFLCLLNSLSQTMSFHFYPTNSPSQPTREEVSKCMGFRCFLGLNHILPLWIPPRYWQIWSVCQSRREHQRGGLFCSKAATRTRGGRCKNLKQVFHTFTLLILLPIPLWGSEWAAVRAHLPPGVKPQNQLSFLHWN